jgi:extradiol dioxygenase family protein
MQHNLREVLHVHDSDVSGSHFANTKLADARFQDVSLRGSKFSDADLSGAQFNDVNLTDVSIADANLAGMRIEGILVTDLLRAHRSESDRASLDRAAMLRPFHIAFPVDDLAAARHFYGTVLGCAEGRSAAEWIDFDLFGHQIVAHLKPGTRGAGADPHHNLVDGHDVPVPHFGVILTPSQWRQLAERVRAAGIGFIIEPCTRFAGQVGEQSTMFFLDPAGNALEFKAFADLSQLFATAVVP